MLLSRKQLWTLKSLPTAIVILQMYSLRSSAASELCKLQEGSLVHILCLQGVLRRCGKISDSQICNKVDFILNLFSVYSNWCFSSTTIWSEIISIVFLGPDPICVSLYFALIQPLSLLLLKELAIKRACYKLFFPSENFPCITSFYSSLLTGRAGLLVEMYGTVLISWLLFFEIYYNNRWVFILFVFSHFLLDRQNIFADCLCLITHCTQWYN